MKIIEPLKKKKHSKKITFQKKKNDTQIKYNFFVVTKKKITLIHIIFWNVYKLFLIDYI